MDLSCKIDVSFYRPETKPYLRAQKMFQDVELWSLENRLRHQSKIMPGNVSSLAMRFLSLFRGGQSFSYLYPYLPIKNWNISVLSRKTERSLICLLIDSPLLKTWHLLTSSIHHNQARYVVLLYRIRSTYTHFRRCRLRFDHIHSEAWTRDGHLPVFLNHGIWEAVKKNSFFRNIS